MEERKSKLDIGSILIIGAGDSPPKPHEPCGIRPFRDLKLRRVISLIHPDNAPSRRVAEKIGMNLEKKTVFRGFPTLVFALTRERWLAEDGAR